MRRTMVLFVATWLLGLTMLVMVGMLLVVIPLGLTPLALFRMLRIRRLVRIHGYAPRQMDAPPERRWLIEPRRFTLRQPDQVVSVDLVLSAPGRHTDAP
jgi:hypothetical protein